MKRDERCSLGSFCNGDLKAATDGSLHPEEMLTMVVVHVVLLILVRVVELTQLQLLLVKLLLQLIHKL